jgi:hypothetical protein
MTCFPECCMRSLGDEHGHVVLSSNKGRKRLEYVLVKAWPVDSCIAAEKSFLLPWDRAPRTKGGGRFPSGVCRTGSTHGHGGLSRMHCAIQHTFPPSCLVQGEEVWVGLIVVGVGRSPQG